MDEECEDDDDVDRGVEDSDDEDAEDTEHDEGREDNDECDPKGIPKT